jgi:hypothetical protein
VAASTSISAPHWVNIHALVTSSKKLCSLHKDLYKPHPPQAAGLGLGKLETDLVSFHPVPMGNPLLKASCSNIHDEISPYSVRSPAHSTMRSSKAVVIVIGIV